MNHKEKFYRFIEQEVDSFLANPKSLYIKCNKLFCTCQINEDGTSDMYGFNLIEAMGAIKTLIRRDRITNKEWYHILGLYRQLFPYFDLE